MSEFEQLNIVPNVVATDSNKVQRQLLVDAKSGALLTTMDTGLNKDDDQVSAFPAAANLAIIGNQTTVTIGSGTANDTLLDSILIVKALTGTVVITGFADSDGAATSITIPVGAVGNFDFGNAINSAGALTITASNAADDNNVLIKWRAA